MKLRKVVFPQHTYPLMHWRVNDEGRIVLAKDENVRGYVDLDLCRKKGPPGKRRVVKIWR